MVDGNGNGNGNRNRNGLTQNCTAAEVHRRGSAEVQLRNATAQRRNDATDSALIPNRLALATL